MRPWNCIRTIAAASSWPGFTSNGIWPSIQHIDGEYHLLKPKTDRSRRTITFPPEIGAAFRRQRLTQLEERLAAGPEWQDSGLAFTNESGGPLYGPHVTRHVQRVLEQAGLPRMRFHDLRHAAATLLLTMGVPMEVIQKTLGHASITTTANIYAHVMPEPQEEPAEKMGAFLRGQA